MLKDIDSLKGRWLELFSQFSNFRETLLSTVTHWEWSNGPRFDPRPFYFQREIARGRLLRKPPEDDSVKYTGYQKTGYDAQGNVIAIRNDYDWETLYYWKSTYVEKFMYRDELHGLARLDYHDRSPAYFISVGFGGDSEDFQKDPKNIWEDATQGKIHIYAEREIYKYADAKIVEINLTRWHNSFNAEIGLKESAANIDYHLTYNTDGKLNQITSQVRPYKNIEFLYRKRQVGETFDTLAERAKSKLIDNIPNVIASAKLSEPLYCLQLRFSDTHFFPPTLIPGFASRRQKLLETLDRPYSINEIWAQVWDSEENADDPDILFPIEDRETLEACERIQIEVGIRGNYSRSKRGLKNLRQVAKALNKVDWKHYTPVTDDFIVFAYDQESLGMALHLSGATPDQILSWRKRGLL